MAKNNVCRCINRHAFTCAVIFLLIVIGPVLIAVDLTYLSEWIDSLKVGDFYTYLTFIGIISLWSIFGFIATIARSVGGISIYMIGLVVVTIVQFIIGFIHIMLLFTTYRAILMDSCLQRQPNRYFWWSLGYEDNEEMKKIYANCSGQWYSFVTERLASWIVYTAFSFVSLYVVVKYQQYVTYQRNRAQGIVKENGEWSDEEGHNDFQEKKPAQVITYHDEELPEDAEFSATMHQQRQKLFDEIAKRKRARKNLNRRSLTSTDGSSRNSVIVHPLDLAQDPEAYQPPPMPPVDGSESWNRYDDPQLNEDQEAIDRQKRVDALSAERLEYEMYRSAPSSRKNSVHTLTEVIKHDASRRKRPKSARWSTCFSETSNSTVNTRRLSSTYEDDEREELVSPHDSPPHEEEDNYEDIKHEDRLSEDEEEDGASNSLLMKPASEEKI